MATTLEAMPGSELAYDEYVDLDHYEIVDGVKVEMPPMSADSQALATRLAVHLSVHGAKHNLGEAYVEMLFKLSLPVDRNRKPDVAFVPYSHWAKDRPLPATNAWEALPSLCVEVVSPHDWAEDIETKLDEYLRAGVRMVWIVYPRHQRIYVQDATGKAYLLKRNDTLDGGEVLPGFQLPLSGLFPMQN